MRTSIDMADDMSQLDSKPATVAVLGLGQLPHSVYRRRSYVFPGALGLVAMKNLLEAGFEVTGFDKNAYVGGLWNYTEHDTTISVLASMRLS